MPNFMGNMRKKTILWNREHKSIFDHGIRGTSQFISWEQGNMYYSLISITDKVELIATEFFQQSCDCLGYIEQHSKSCKSYLVGKYIYF